MTTTRPTPQIIRTRPFPVVPDIFQEAFEDLPLDPFVAGGFRRHAVSRFAWRGGLKLLPTLPLHMPKKYNAINAGVERHYPSLPARLLTSDEFRHLCDSWLQTVPEPIETFSVHQFRTAAPGLPQPEGPHTDGNDWLGLFVVKRQNIAGGGGVTNVWGNVEEDVLFQDVLEAGDFLSVEDRVAVHYTTPITREVAIQTGYRDIMVFGAPDHEHYTKGKRVSDPAVRVARVNDDPQTLVLVRDLFREYAAELKTLGVDLAYQDFDGEVAGLPGAYGPPSGVLLLATFDGQAVGCCGLRRLAALETKRRRSRF